MLGLRRRGATFSVDPCIPSTWPRYEMVWRFLGSRYEIAVANPLRRCRGVVSAELDGLAVDREAIPLIDDGRVHHVRIVMGDVPDRAKAEPLPPVRGAPPPSPIPLQPGFQLLLNRDSHRKRPAATSRLRESATHRTRGAQH